MRKFRCTIIIVALVSWAVGNAQEKPSEKDVSEVLKQALDAYNTRDAQALFKLFHPELQEEFQEDFQNPSLRALWEVPPPNLLAFLQWGLDHDHSRDGKMLSAELKGFDAELKRYNVLFRYEISGVSEGFIALKRSEEAWLIIDADFN